MTEKNRLKNKALLAQTLYSMEQMIRLFYEDLTQTNLPLPSESTHWKREQRYGEGVPQNELKYLEFLSNRFHLNPKPKLILVVEGDGEEQQLPRLTEGLFGLSFPRLGIEVISLEGVGNFTGRKNNRYSALEKFIDYQHQRQTIVFIILDGEGGVDQVKRRLVQLRSKFFPKRTITKGDYIHIWDKSIEFDNFSDAEIALAMTALDNKYTFQSDEIAECRRNHSKGNPLISLFEQRCHWQPSKLHLLEKLVDTIIASPEKELDENHEPTRPLLRVMKGIVELTSLNHQPVAMKYWQRNQESGHLGEVAKD